MNVLNLIKYLKREARHDAHSSRTLNEEVGRNIPGQENYILLPETKDHTDILIAKSLLSLNQEIEQAARGLSLVLQNTAEEQNNHSYIGNISHQQALDLTKALGFLTLNTAYFREHLRNLRDGALGSIVVYDGKGNELSRTESEILFNEITEQREPWRSEWLNDRFIKKKGSIYVVRNKFDSSGKLVETTEQLDKEALGKDKFISLDEWLNNATIQGLPRKDISNGSLYYRYPRANSVTTFVAGCFKVYLDCLRDQLSSDPARGVRLAKFF